MSFVVDRSRRKVARATLLDRNTKVADEPAIPLTAPVLLAIPLY